MFDIIATDKDKALCPHCGAALPGRWRTGSTAKAAEFICQKCKRTVLCNIASRTANAGARVTRQ